jgi:hypothetical protein
MSVERIIVALGSGNMKGLSMLQVFDKANNSVNDATCTRDWVCSSLVSVSKLHQDRVSKKCVLLRMRVMEARILISPIHCIWTYKRRSIQVHPSGGDKYSIGMCG